MSFRVAFFWGFIYFLVFVFVGAVKSRPVGDEVCHIAKEGECGCQCIKTQTSTWSSLAYLYKRLFIQSFTPLELEMQCHKCQSECTKHRKAECKNGRCAGNKCECSPCWQGESCDQPANNNPPKFEQESYTAQIPASSDVDVIVLAVGAFDKDKKKCSKEVPCPCARIAYSITGGNEEGFFSIEGHSGKIRVSKSLKAHDGSSFDLTVSAQNEGQGFNQKKDTANVHIEVAALKQRHRRSVEHHVVRRSTPAASPSGIIVIKPEVLNNTFYKPGDNIMFNITLSHNQSASSFAPDTNLQVKCNSAFLEAIEYVAQSGVASSSHAATNGEFTFTVASLNQNDVASVTFKTTVKTTIHPLANLYMVCEATGTKSGTSYKIGPVSSSPSLYAVFPKVTLTRITAPSKSLFDIDDVLQYRMVIDMPHLNFPLYVEVTSAINDFSFMPIHDVKITSKGSNIVAGPGGVVNPTPQYTKSSSDLTFHDSATLDFKNLTVTAASDVDNKIQIEWKVNLTDHPLLANGSKHWNGAGLSSGPNMLHVAQQAIYIQKIEPTVTCTLTPQNDTAATRFSIDDKLSFNFECNHTNTSTADARNATIKCYSTYLEFVTASYSPAGGSVNSFTKINATMLDEITVARLNQSEKITGNLNMKVGQNINPLVELDVFCQIAYQNLAGKNKMTTTHKAVPPAIAAVPIISLNIVNPLSCYKVGSEIELQFKVLVRKMNTPLLVELIAPVNTSSPIMAITSVTNPMVGANIMDQASLASKRASCKSTVNDTMFDRCTIDFGTVKSIVGVANASVNEISFKFNVLLNDHPNVTNGSKHWAAVGVRGGSRMMWIGETAVTVCMSADPKPILKLESNCYVPHTSTSCCEGNLETNNQVQFNITLTHNRELSEQHADNVKILHMIPIYVEIWKELFKSPSEMIYTKTLGGPELKNIKELRFKDELSFSYLATLDPSNLMPPGDIQATSVAEVIYYGHALTLLSKKAGVCCYFKKKGPTRDSPVVQESPLPGETQVDIHQNVGTRPSLHKYYKRGILLIPESKTLFVCSENTARTNCFYTTDAGVSWVALSEQVGRIIGNVGETLYAISSNKRAYMKQESRAENWYAITPEDWAQVKSSAEAKLRKYDDNLSEDDPTSFSEDSNSNKYGANKNGIYFQSSGSGSWIQKAMWKCCG